MPLKVFYFPEDAGMPIGEPGDTDVFILQTHYNNPGLRSGKLMYVNSAYNIKFNSF